MKFKATAKGFYISRINPGQEFDAPDDFKARWADPVEKPKKPRKKKATKSKEG